MKLAIMQPYFFPYLGYFSLINAVDEFVLLEDVQFIKHGWIERNRILKQTGDWQYISVPLEKYHRETLISDIRIKNQDHWKKKILDQLVFYKKSANYYYKTIDLVKRSLEIDTESITELNLHILRTLCDYLDIDTPITIFSQQETPIAPPKEADEWALHICLGRKNVDTYLNPQGGAEFFDSSKYAKNQIDLQFLRMGLQAYPQLPNREEFISGLSILDVLMFQSVEEVKEQLFQYEIFRI